MLLDLLDLPVRLAALLQLLRPCANVPQKRCAAPSMLTQQGSEPQATAANPFLRQRTACRRACRRRQEVAPRPRLSLGYVVAASARLRGRQPRRRPPFRRAHPPLIARPARYGWRAARVRIRQRRGRLELRAAMVRHWVLAGSGDGRHGARLSGTVCVELLGACDDGRPPLGPPTALEGSSPAQPQACTWRARGMAAAWPVQRRLPPARRVDGINPNTRPRASAWPR
jgi:hypothetical protein